MASTPPPDPYKYHPTPQKAKIRGKVEYLEPKNIKYTRKEVCNAFEIPTTSRHCIVHGDSSRRHHNKPDTNETHGRKSIITSSELKAMEHILKTEGLKGRGLTWESLGMLLYISLKYILMIARPRVEVDASGCTIQRAMDTLNYRKCIACTKSLTTPQTAEQRLAYIKTMLECPELASKSSSNAALFVFVQAKPIQ